MRRRRLTTGARRDARRVGRRRACGSGVRTERRRRVQRDRRQPQPPDDRRPERRRSRRRRVSRSVRSGCPSGDLLYTADGKIKRRPAAGGAARIVEFSADVSFTRPAFTPKRHRFDLAGPQPVRGIMHPAVSPDGRQIAFAALGDLWLMPVDGAPRRLTSDPALDTAPAWSPDGQSLAYVLRSRAGR